MQKEPSLKKNIILSTIYQVLTMITPFISAPYVSRVLGSSGIGVFSYTQSIESFFLLFASLGTAAYGTREIARSRNDTVKRSQLFWEIQFLKILTTGIVLAAWFGFLIIVPEYKIIYLIMSISLAANVFDVSWFYAGIERFEFTVYKNIICKIISIICIFVFVNKSEDLLIYVLINVFSTSLGHISMWIGIRRFIQSPDWKKIEIYPHFKETIIYFIPTIATSVYTILDKALIGMITHNADENGYYEQATKIVNMCKSLTFVAMNQVLSSRISYLFAEKKYDEIKDRIKTSINYILFMGIGIGFGLHSIAASFTPVFFGEGFNQVIVLLKLMSPIVVIIGISYSLGSQYYTPAGLRATSAKFIVSGCIINLCLNLILIPYFASCGAVISSVIAEFTITVLFVKFGKEYLRISTIFKLAWKKLFAGLVMWIVIMSMYHTSLDGIKLVAAQFVLGSTVYIFVLVLLRDSVYSLVKYKFLHR